MGGLLAARRLAAVLCMTVTLGLGGLALPGAAMSAPGDPFFVFTPLPPKKAGEPPAPPPVGYFNGPCGLAVDSNGTFLVSDHYHGLIDVFAPTPPKEHTYVGQVSGGDPLSNPCGIAVSSTDTLYVNNYHHAVRIAGGAAFDTDEPTGVAVDTTTDTVYVNDRTYVAVYDSSGVPILDGGLPLKIGLGSLTNGYGIAVSQFPATAGRIYVPDAATDTVKVYDPATDKVNPVATISGPPGGFTSLRDAAIAVDRVSGKVYVANNLQPKYTERPEAAIEVFSSAGAHLGKLKYKIIDALPPGLAVDNSEMASQGRVYVTSGNTEQASVYAYPPGSELPGSLPAQQELEVGTSGNGAGVITSDLGELSCSSSCEAEIRSGAKVTLSAEPEPGSAFAGFSGAGCGGAGTCTLEMDGAKSVEAEFVVLTSGSTSSGTGPSAPVNAAPLASGHPGVLKASPSLAAKAKAQVKSKHKRAKQRQRQRQKHHHNFHHKRNRNHR